jgi:subtilisin family serine protease
MRYVMANRRAGKFGLEAKRSSRAAVASALGMLTNKNVLADQNADSPELRRIVVFEAEPGEVEAKMTQFSPDAIVEPEIKYYPVPVLFSHTFPSDFLPPHGFIDTPASPGLSLQIAVAGRTATGQQQPLPRASVTLYCRGPGNPPLQRMQTQISNGQGSVVFGLANGFTPAALVAAPADSFWTVIRRGGLISGETIFCPQLPQSGPGAWWHKAAGINTPGDLQLGNGIKVGIIDTGCGPNRALSHVSLEGDYIGGLRHHGAVAAADVESHGSHTAGIIGARPLSSGDYAGIAPGAELYAMRVFRKGEEATQEDIAGAIDVLSEEKGCDLLNLSLGSTERSQILEDVIQDAFERGTLCVCAAGNDAGPVNYPAAYQNCIAVSAIGLAGWGPSGSLSETRLPDRQAFYGEENYYLANFSSFGAELACAAPGVGIISTVPDPSGQRALYAVMDGSSMASPAACGTLAVLLSRDNGYRGLPRNITRSQMARTLLLRNCRPIGLVPKYEGRGIPFV